MQRATDFELRNSVGVAQLSYETFRQKWVERGKATWDAGAAQQDHTCKTKAKLHLEIWCFFLLRSLIKLKEASRVS